MPDYQTVSDDLRVEREPREDAFVLVAEFHRAFGAPIASTPTFDIGERLMLRLDLLVEEVIEAIEVAAGPITAMHMREAWITARAQAENPPVGVYAFAALEKWGKELADVNVVLQGAALETGIPLPSCTEEVMRSNMSKLGADGRPILREDGKIMKGPDYVEADISNVLWPF